MEWEFGPPCATHTHNVYGGEELFPVGISIAKARAFEQEGGGDRTAHFHCAVGASMYVYIYAQNIHIRLFAAVNLGLGYLQYAHENVQYH
jgi:hypothetical protein